MEKAEVRRELACRRRALGPDETAAASQAVCDRLQTVAAVVDALLAAVYVAISGEVDLTLFINAWLKRGKEILLPRFNAEAGCYDVAPVADVENETTIGKYAIREPLPSLAAAPSDLLNGPDVAWLVPGVAFDRRGARLGRGGGYYDRLLAGVAGPKIGVAYDWQIVPDLPQSPHDVPMDMVVTDKRILRFTAE